MPTTYLYPSSDVSVSNWSILGDSTAAAVTDDPHGSYDDLTTNLYGGVVAVCDAFVNMDNLPANAAGVTSVQVCGRGKKENAGGTRADIYVRINGSDYMNLDFNTVAWNTYTDVQTTNPDTSKDWTVSDVNALQLRFWRKERDDTYWGRITAGHLDVIYSTGGGGLIVFLGQWLPPLLAVASHSLMKSEIAQILSNLKTRPANDEDFAYIINKFQVQPKYCFQGWSV